MSSTDTTAISTLTPLAPYPGIAGGEAVVVGLRIAGPLPSESEKVAAVDSSDKTSEEGIKKNGVTTAQPSSSVLVGNSGSSDALSTMTSLSGASATYQIDEALLSTLLEALARQHQSLVAELTSLSDIVSTEAMMSVCNLVEATSTLEDLFRRIDLLHAKVEYLNSYVVQPLAAAVKSIHAPRDLKGKALNVLKSFSLLKSAANKIGGSTDEEEAEAMWSRIPPFVLIGGPVGVVAGGSSSGAHQLQSSPSFSSPSSSSGNYASSPASDDDSKRKQSSAPYGSPFPVAGGGSPTGGASFTLAANLSLLQPLTALAQRGGGRGIGCGDDDTVSTSSAPISSTNGQQLEGNETAKGTSVSKRSYFKKDYTGGGEEVDSHSAAEARSAQGAPVAVTAAPAVTTRNPREFREEIVSNSVFYFENSTANRL